MDDHDKHIELYMQSARDLGLLPEPVCLADGNQAIKISYWTRPPWWRRLATRLGMRKSEREIGYERQQTMDALRRFQEHVNQHLDAISGSTSVTRGDQPEEKIAP